MDGAHVNTAPTVRPRTALRRSRDGRRRSVGTSAWSGGTQKRRWRWPGPSTASPRWLRCRLSNQPSRAQQRHWTTEIRRSVSTSGIATVAGAATGGGAATTAAAAAAAARARMRGDDGRRRCRPMRACSRAVTGHRRRRIGGHLRCRVRRAASGFFPRQSRRRSHRRHLPRSTSRRQPTPAPHHGRRRRRLHPRGRLPRRRRWHRCPRRTWVRCRSTWSSKSSTMRALKTTRSWAAPARAACRSSSTVLSRRVLPPSRGRRVALALGGRRRPKHLLPYLLRATATPRPSRGHHHSHPPARARAQIRGPSRCLSGFPSEPADWGTAAGCTAATSAQR
mmetsp:Transcript_41194/g.95029  ORF Transcript_41194/g.95029 Transcript_41194/m.95029 type:complete len:336 (+) Transcript_41194:666-1673(+)